MASTAILAIRIVSDASKAARELQGMDTATGKWQGRMQKANQVAKGTALGLVAIGTAAFQQASKLQQADGAVQAVFKSQGDAVRNLAKNAANSVGLAQSEYSELASVMGAQLSNMGVAQSKLVGTTDGLINKGADLAAQFGGTTKEAVEALGSALRGETDPIERYGISIKEATIQAELARRGQDKLKGSAAKTARTQALLGLISKQSASSQGAFAREANTAAGQQQRAMANVKNAAAELGMVLLPVVAKAAEGLAKMAGWVQDNSGKVTALAAVVGGLAAIVMAVNAAMTAYTAVMAVYRGVMIVARNVQLAFNLAMMVNPAAVIILGIIAFIAVLVLAYKKVGWFRNAVNAVFRAIKAVAVAVWNAIKAAVLWAVDKAVAAFQWLKGAAAAVWKAISSAAQWVIQAVSKIVGWVKGNLVRAFQVYKAIAVAVWRAVMNAAGWVIDKVRTAVSWVKDKLAGAFNTAKSVATKAFDAIRSPIQWVIDKVQALINKIRGIDWPSPPGWLKSAGGAVGGLFGSGSLMGSAPSLQAAGGLSAAAGGGRSTGQPTMIVIQGALDPDAVARQVEKLLGQRARRVGAVRP